MHEIKEEENTSMRGGMDPEEMESCREGCIVRPTTRTLIPIHPTSLPFTV